MIAGAHILERAVILLAEDDEDYVTLVRKAFAEAYISNPLYVVSTGPEAMAYLQGTGKYRSRDEYPLPDLLLLDLKLPGYSGFEILTWVRAQPELAGLRILVLTSSDQMKDVNEAYRLGANSFLTKPYDFQNLVEFTRLIQEFWLRASKCPESSRPDKDAPKPKDPNEPVSGKP